jgi:Clp amino terminal domain, pathogenicity island component
MAGDAWREAAAIAREADATWLGTDMLLVGLTRSGGVAQAVLAEAGITDAAFSQEVIQANRTQVGVRQQDQQSDPKPTPAAEQARGCADGLALALAIEDRHVTLLLALLYDRDGLHGWMFRRAGADRGSLVRALAARGAGVPPTMPAPEPPRRTEQVTLPEAQADVVIDELVRRTTTEPAEWFDAWGAASWGYGADPDRPDVTRITGETRIRLRELVPEILAANGFPEPTEDAWETLDPA